MALHAVATTTSFDRAVEIAGLQLVERADQRFGALFHRRFLPAVPIEVAGEGGEAEHHRRDQRLAVPAREAFDEKPMIAAYRRLYSSALGGRGIG